MTNPHLDKLKERAGRALGRTSPGRKQGAAALGVSRQRFSQMVLGQYPELEVAYEIVALLAKNRFTDPDQVTLDLHQFGVEAKIEDLSSWELLTRLFDQVTSLRDGCRAGLQVCGIAETLQARGIGRLKQEIAS